ncbi:MAG: TetR/AcrR family transcriptional regulator [Bacteroidetes bacterium]|nr:TetR/AcrR family transcriptional regulator [Bacteroidota bacterium]
MANDTTTEQKILEAAEDVFHEKGYDGARMQEIAEQAGINKGLLHYYFKTKDKLFEAIFSAALNRMISRILSILELEIPLDQKIDLIVDQYMGMLMKNPALPRFVLNELNKNPDQFIAKHFKKDIKDAFANFSASVKKEADNGTIKQIDGHMLFMNMISMIIFPFIGRPLIQVVLGSDNAEFKQIMLERKEHIKKFIKDAIRV